MDESKIVQLSINELEHVHDSINEQPYEPIIGRKERVTSSIEDDKIKRMYADGLSKRQIARTLKISEGTVRNRLKENEAK